MILSIIETYRCSQHHVECDHETGNIHPQQTSMGVQLTDDTTPQKQRHDLTVDDLLPSAEDGQAFFDRAVLYTMQLITENFPSLASLKKFLAPPNITLPQKSVVIPQKVLFRDEKYIDENIKILWQYIKDCKFTGNPQVFQMCHF